MSYAINRLRARTVNNMPSQTDQSQAEETDINVIIRDFMKTGQATGPAEEPMWGDFTELPTDLRGMIEQSREIAKLRRDLPKELRDLPVEQLLTMQPTDIKAMLTPPEPTKEETKA